MNVFARWSLITAAFLFASCTSQLEKFDYHATIAAGPDGWPIWAEEITLDGRFLPGGINGRGFDNVPPVGASTVMRDPAPAPAVIEARWFSYREQKYYQVRIELPDDTRSKLRDWYEKYPTPDYAHYILLGFSGKGEALAWWLARCSDCGFDRSQDFSTSLIDNVKAQEVSDDPAKYRLQAQKFIDEGRIPASVLY